MTKSLPALLAAILLSGHALPAAAEPSLPDPSVGELRLVASGSALPRVDGLAFDAFGNLFAALEVVGSRGGIVYVDKTTGSVSPLLAAISGADQVKLHPSGSLYVTSELNPPPGSVGGVYRVDLTYVSGIPVSASGSYLTTAPAVIDNPEGLVALRANGSYGQAGDLIVAEDRTGGRVIRISLAASPAPTATLVSGAAALQRPEGLAFGDFAGKAAPALYAAETVANRVLRIDSSGTFAEFGNSAAAGLTLPDNLAFGPDGFLYVTEDLTGSRSGRILRLDAGGNYSTFAEGFKKPAGLAFDPLSGDLYVAEQDLARIWRVQFAAPVPAVPEPAPWLFMAVGAVLVGYVTRARHSRNGRTTQDA